MTIISRFYRGHECSAINAVPIPVPVSTTSISSILRQAAQPFGLIMLPRQQHVRTQTGPTLDTLNICAIMQTEQN